MNLTSTNNKATLGRIFLGLVTLAAVAALTYTLARPWVSTWGATEEEAQGMLPGDEVGPPAQIQSTRPITIDAPAEEVWPWLVQIGWGRAGFYSYNWIENLMGADLHNADRIHPEWQNLKVGDEVWMAPPARYEDISKLVVAEIQPNRALVFVRPDVPGSGGVRSRLHRRKNHTAYRAWAGCRLGHPPVRDLLSRLLRAGALHYGAGADAGDLHHANRPSSC
jgi:hypothetical protein